MKKATSFEDSTPHIWETVYFYRQYPVIHLELK